MSNWRIFIPTRDSARWIGVFHDSYRAIGVEPLYVVDARSRDGTLELLKSRGAQVVAVTPEGSFVEAGMIAAGCEHVGAEWALRMDDDEFPSQALLNWISEQGVFSIRPFWQISRRELIRREGGIFYSRRRSAYAHPNRPNYLSGQLRFHRTQNLKFSNKIHSSGFDTIVSAAFAPQECFFIHCVDLLLSPAQRLNKILNYEAIEAGAAWRVADEYLPELFDDALLRPANDGLTEFSGLIENLPAQIPAPFVIDEALRAQAVDGVKAWTDHIAAQSGSDVAKTPSVEFLRYLPRSAWRSVAKTLLTFGRAARFGQLRGLGEEIWNLADFYRV